MAEGSKSYSTDPTLWLYTSLSSGSSHIVTATSRLEVILKANRIPFQALDVATDEKARMLWGRRAGKRKLPGLVKQGMVVADLEEVEEWNEYDEIEENLGPREPLPAGAPAFKSNITVNPTKPGQATPVAKGVPTAISQSTASTKVASTSGPAAPPLPDPKSAPVPIQVTTTSDSTPSTQTTTTSTISRPTDDKTKAAGQMQSMGAEVAEKAKQMRSAKLKAMAAGASTSKSDDTKTEQSTEDAVSKEELEADNKDTDETGDSAKLDSSALIPPPSGETLAEDAVAPDTGDAKVESKAEDVPETKTELEKVEQGEESKVDAAGPESPLPDTNKSLETEPVTSTDVSKTETKNTEPEGEEATSVDAKGPESPLPQADKALETEPIVDTTSTKLASDKEEPKTEEESKVEEDSKIDADGPESPLPDADKALETEPVASSTPAKVEKQSTLEQHRSSSIADADAQEIKKNEDSTKIPEGAEEDETKTLEAKQEVTTDIPEQSKENTPNDIQGVPIEKTVDPVDKDRSIVALDGQEDKPSEPPVKTEDGHLSPEIKSAATASSPKVQFGGEAPGEEIDRVKIALEQSATNLEAETSPKMSPTRAEHTKDESIDELTSKDKTYDAEKKTEVAEKDVKVDSESERSVLKATPQETTSKDKGEALSGNRTQDQNAADANKAGESVAD